MFDVQSIRATAVQNACDSSISENSGVFFIASLWGDVLIAHSIRHQRVDRTHWALQLRVDSAVTVNCPGSPARSLCGWARTWLGMYVAGYK